MSDEPAEQTPAQLRSHMATIAVNLAATVEQMPAELFAERARREIRGPDDPHGLEFDTAMRAAMKWLAASQTLALAVAYLADSPRRPATADSDKAFARLIRNVVHRTLHDVELDHALNHFHDIDAPKDPTT
ncbi:hypothetical protein [Streptomyces sp. cg35]|uniref:hypothetical protein n=1 Tax=Streptomyces sp. cg35 TaxID=3421650 RepID=UPI003D168923